MEDLLKIKYKVLHKDAWVVLSVHPDKAKQTIKGLRSVFVEYPYGNNSDQLPPTIKQSSRMGTKDNK